MGFLVPDLVHYAGARGGLMPEPGDLFFFDLETTGLSGGAGTLAFLAGFGRLAPSASSLLVDQYLLLDYPGEDDFIRALLEEFAPPANGVSPLVISFNGKTFDSQILKTRCLMTGRKVPDYFHGDLLHPARRLWKDRLPSCSQSSIETLILGLDRGDDLGGEWAPDIWFDFLRTREAGPLLGICRHNLRDLSGLAAILGVLTEIALDPLTAGEKYRCGNEALAFLWRRGLRRGGGFFTAEDGETGLRLLEKAAAEGAPRSCRILAVEAEWRRRDYRAALFYTERALEGPPGGGALPAALAEDLLRRRDRLLRRLEGRARIPPGAATGF
jgi:uncharacterized protein YprB with RNaseH-like and TPR domain